MSHAPHFNPNWVVNGRFANGYLQGTRVDAGEIECRAYDYLHAAHYNVTGYWTPEKVAELEAEISSAIAKAEAA